jgi:hypothetical protein
MMDARAGCQVAPAASAGKRKPRAHKPIERAAIEFAARALHQNFPIGLQAKRPKGV